MWIGFHLQCCVSDLHSAFDRHVSRPTPSGENNKVPCRCPSVPGCPQPRAVLPAFLRGTGLLPPAATRPLCILSTWLVLPSRLFGSPTSTEQGGGMCRGLACGDSQRPWPAALLANASDRSHGTRMRDDGSGEPIVPTTKNTCLAESRPRSSSPGVKENLFMCLLDTRGCEQIVSGDRSGRRFSTDAVLSLDTQILFRVLQPGCRHLFFL